MKTIITTLFILFSFVSLTQNSIIEYYNEIAGKSEYGDTNHVLAKWKDNVKIYFDFEDSDTIRKYSEEVIKDLNDLIVPITISIVDKKSDANLFIYCGTFDEYKKRYNIVIDGKFLGFTCTNFYNNTIYRGYVFINKRSKGDTLKSVIREEITQSFGLANDSWKYPESIFFQGSNLNTEFSSIDKEIIKLHYNK
jgi:hypothetical protein